MKSSFDDYSINPPFSYYAFFPATAWSARTTFRTSVTFFAKVKVILAFASLGISAMSLRFRAGSMTVVIPARFAARIFSFRPPTGILFQTADRQYQSLEGNLTGHRHIRSRRPALQQRHQRGEHRHPRRRPVLRHGAGRYMDMVVVSGELLRIDIQAFGAGLDDSWIW